MQRRLTIDVDSFKFYDIWTKLYFHREMFKRIEVKPSSKKGYHIILWLKESVSDINHFKLRSFFGDDKARIWLDKKRLKNKEPINILFSKKRDFFYKRKWKKQ